MIPLAGLALERLRRETELYNRWLRDWQPLEQPYFTPDDVTLGDEGELGGEG